MTVPVYTDKPTVFADVQTALVTCRSPMTASHVRYNGNVLDSKFEFALPFLSILDISNPDIKFDTFIEAIADDLFYYRKTIILIVDDETIRKKKFYLEKYEFVISILKENEISDQLCGILALFNTSVHLLINWELQALTSNSITNTFVLFCNYRAIPLVCQALLRLMRRLRIIEQERVEPTHIALLEMLSNAMEHGNYEITYQDKTEWLKDHVDIDGLIQQRSKEKKYRNRQVILDVAIFATHIHVQIQDAGQGFDWRTFQKSLENDAAPQRHGNGIVMVMQYTQNLTYNQSGNAVSFDVPLDSAMIKKERPKYFTYNNPRITLQKAEKLLDENADYSWGNSDYCIYLIIEGELNVYKDKHLIGKMTADDIFSGELSYLLQRNRVAAVVAHKTTRLISISADQFSDLIKSERFYSFCLARILANRLENTNEMLYQRIKDTA